MVGVERYVESLSDFFRGPSAYVGGHAAAADVVLYDMPGSCSTTTPIDPIYRAPIFGPIKTQSRSSSLWLGTKT